MNNNILDDEYRKKFLSSADNKSLNKYLKYIEGLAKKNNKYMEIYQKDLEYVMELNKNECHVNANVFGIFKGCNFTATKCSEYSECSEMPCNTEGFVTKINTVFTNNKNRNDVNHPASVKGARNVNYVNNLNANYDAEHINANKNKILELKSILQKLSMSQSNHSVYIEQFIHAILSLNIIENNNNENNYHAHIFKEYYKKIIKTIISNKQFLLETFNSIGKMIKKNDISEEFIRKYNSLKADKKKLSNEQYTKNKLFMFQEYEKKIGIRKIYVSILVNKVIHAYKTHTISK